MTIRSLQALAVVFCAVAPVTAHAEGTAQVMIENDRLEPWTLETLTGQRVNFVNRTGYPVHLQFIGDVRRHEVIQIPATPPSLGDLSYPGDASLRCSHHGRETRALDGVISVMTDETHQWQSRTCDVVVEGNCIAAP